MTCRTPARWSDVPPRQRDRRIMTSLAEFFGRTHPVLLHFPIVLLWVGAGCEVARVWRDSPFLARAVAWLLALGAFSALVTAGSGWLLAAHEHVRSDQRGTLEWHRWFGVATAGLACLAWAAVARWNATAAPGLRWLRHVLVWSAAAFVTAAGHLGATVVWGKDWFS